MTRFKKGTSGNPAGRPKGAENKLKRDFREFLASALDENSEKFRQTLKTAKGARFLRYYLEAMTYVTPKLKQVEYREVPDLESFLRMTPDEREALIKELQTQLDNEK